MINFEAPSEMDIPQIKKGKCIHLFHSACVCLCVTCIASVSKQQAKTQRNGLSTASL